MSSREEFEAWWEINYHNGNPPRFGWAAWRDGDGYKIDDDESELDGMWNAWQAATNALEAKCAALAAELKQSQIDAGCYKKGMDASNARLVQVAAELSAFDAIHDDAVFITDDHYEQCPAEAQKIIRTLAVMQIPAYKSFLAEVRASGVEMFARSLRGEAEITKACTFKPVQQFEEFAARADECAAKLRQDANTAELVAAGIITKVGE